MAGAAAPNVDILIDGQEVPDSNFISYVVERDMYQPDMAAVVLSNQNDIYSAKWQIGAPVEVKVGKDLVSIFKGEIVQFEAVYRGDATTQLLVRAMNKMHRLKRLRRSKTYAEKSDKDILSQVVQEAGLTLDWKGPQMTYKHVYQHNLSGLEFVRMRAARLGLHVWCVDTKIMVKEPDFSATSGVKISVDEGGDLRRFTPRISSANVVKKVSVKGWNPETKELITGVADAASSPLGSQNAVAACGDHGKEETFTVDQPIWSKEEADAIAKGRLRDLNLTFLTGEAEMAGNAKVEIGTVIEIEANAKNAADPFNGKYYVMGVTHRHTMPKGKDGGFSTIAKLARDAQKK